MSTYKQFDFAKATPGMADAMRRLYQMRIECGVPDNNNVLEKIEEKRLKALKKIDKFEYNKAILMDKIANTFVLVKEQIESKDAAKNEYRTKNNIRKNMRDIEQEFEKLKELQTNVKKSTGIWSKIPGDPKIIESREKDIKNISLHIEHLKKNVRRSQLIDKKDDKKNKIQIKVQDVDELPNDTAEELPTVDISEGLEQIEQNKKKINSILTVIESQVDQMQQMAHDMHDELETQSKLLTQMEKDVDTYIKSLDTLNTRLADAIEKNGGVCKLIAFAILIIICLSVAGTIYFAVSNFLNK